MSGSFTTGCDIVDIPGGEAKWAATFGTTDGGVVVNMCDTKAEAVEWLERKTRAFLGERVVLEAPDGDGVVVSPHHEDRVVFTAPAVAVRVRESSPMFSSPQIAAQAVERIHYALRLLDEAAGVLTDADFPGDLARMVWAAKGRVVTLMEHSACEVFEQWPVRNVDESPVLHLERHLSVVPDGGAA